VELGRQLVQERQSREAALATIARMETTLGAVRQAGVRMALVAHSNQSGFGNRSCSSRTAESEHSVEQVTVPTEGIIPSSTLKVSTFAMCSQRGAG